VFSHPGNLNRKANNRPGEGNFDDNSAKPSGAATPVPAADGPPSKKKKGVSKKAKSIKERLAFVDGG
jgi:DNA helicase INO80